MPVSPANHYALRPTSVRRNCTLKSAFRLGGPHRVYRSNLRLQTVPSRIRPAEMHVTWQRRAARKRLQLTRPSKLSPRRCSDEAPPQAARSRSYQPLPREAVGPLARVAPPASAPFAAPACCIPPYPARMPWVVCVPHTVGALVSTRLRSMTLGFWLSDIGVDWQRSLCPGYTIVSRVSAHTSTCKARSINASSAR